MCLDYKYTTKEKKEFLAKLPNEFYAYKSSVKLKDGFLPPFYGDEKYRAGINKFKTNIIYSTHKLLNSFSYVGGCHLWIKRLPRGHGIGKWSRGGNYIIRVKVNKKHIKTVGTQFGEIVITVSQAKFPKCCGER